MTKKNNKLRPAKEVQEDLQIKMEASEELAPRSLKNKNPENFTQNPENYVQNPRLDVEEAEKAVQTTQTTQPVQQVDTFEQK